MKILIIDSDQFVYRDLKNILTKKKCVVEYSLFGLDAENALRTNDFDLAILNINSTKKNGIDLIKGIRKYNQSCPIIVLSTVTDLKIKIETLDSGADDYLVKPFDMEELLVRLRVLIRRQFIKHGPIFNFGNTTLDRNNCTIYTEYGTEKLLSKEVQIMELLMKNINEIVTTDTIINKVWTTDSYSIETNLWVFLSYIRKKLKKINSNIIIKNHRNLGYRLEIKTDNII